MADLQKCLKILRDAKKKCTISIKNEFLGAKTTLLTTTNDNKDAVASKSSVTVTTKPTLTS